MIKKNTPVTHENHIINVCYIGSSDETEMLGVKTIFDKKIMKIHRGF